MIGTNPAAGIIQNFGAKIHLIPSSGIAVPNVVNLPSATAAAQLRQAGFVVQLLTEPSDSFPSGVVTHTNPPAGTGNLAGGSVVAMYVSTGQAMVSVPSVQGLTVAKAQNALHQSNLVGSVLLEPTTLKGNNGKVLSQSPAANEQVLPGSTVVLHVGQYTPSTTTSSTPPSTTTTSTPPGP